MRAAMLLMLAGGCYTPEQFEVDVDYAICDWAADCFDTPDTTVGSYDYCFEPRPEPETVETECAFYHSQAKKCVNKIERMNCPISKTMMPMPEECDQVWECP